MMLFAINYQDLVTPSTCMMNYTHTPSMTETSLLRADTFPSWADAPGLLLLLA